MIRYSISLPELEELIETQQPGWLKRARRRTAGFKKKKAYAEKSSIWSEIKVVYMRLQGGSKCAFCERMLEAETYGKGEQDVEHFRPKGSVRAWTDGASLKVPLTAVPQTGGYYQLPYHLFNYAAACKPCNSALKMDYFPIAGTYRLDGDDPESLAEEKPYLIYPLGTLDEDPEDLIEFQGVAPRPRVRSGFRRNRARVTIRFFRLGDAVERKNLIRERARLLMALFPQLTAEQSGASAARKERAREVIRAYTEETSPHTNCCRSFVRLFKKNPVEAEKVHDAACELIASKS